MTSELLVAEEAGFAFEWALVTEKLNFAGLSQTSAALTDKQLQHPNLSLLLTEQEQKVCMTHAFTQASQVRVRSHGKLQTVFACCADRLQLACR